MANIINFIIANLRITDYLELSLNAILNTSHIIILLLLTLCLHRYILLICLMTFLKGSCRHTVSSLTFHSLCLMDVIKAPITGTTILTESKLCKTQHVYPWCGFIPYAVFHACILYKHYYV